MECLALNRFSVYMLQLLGFYQLHLQNHSKVIPNTMGLSHTKTHYFTSQP